MEGSPVLDSPTAANYLGLAKRTLDNWRVSGCGPQFIKIGRRVVYRQSDLDAFLEGGKRTSTSQRAE